MGQGADGSAAQDLFFSYWLQGAEKEVPWTVEINTGWGFGRGKSPTQEVSTRPRPGKVYRLVKFWKRF
jgi:hypothetical protein